MGFNGARNGRMGGLNLRSSKGEARGRVAPRDGGLPGRLLGREFYEQRPEVVAPRLLGKLLVCWPFEQVGAKGPGLKASSVGASFRGPEGPRSFRNRSSIGDRFSIGHPSPVRHPELLEGVMVGRIVEVEAYLGPHNNPPDPAAHSHRGPTPRNQVLFGLAGHAYVYAIYGRYFCLNVSCEAEGLAGSVLLRAMEPVAGAEAMARNRGLAKGEWESERGLRLLASGPSRMCMALGILRTSHNGLDVTDARSPLQIWDDGFREAEALVTARIGINETNEAVDWPLRFAVPGNASVSGPKNMKGRRVPVP